MTKYGGRWNIVTIFNFETATTNSAIGAADVSPGQRLGDTMLYNRG